MSALAPAPGGDDRKKKREPLERPGDGKSGVFAVQVEAPDAPTKVRVFDDEPHALAYAGAMQSFGDTVTLWQL